MRIPELTRLFSTILRRSNVLGFILILAPYGLVANQLKTLLLEADINLPAGKALITETIVIRMDEQLAIPFKVIYHDQTRIRNLLVVVDGREERISLQALNGRVETGLLELSPGLSSRDSIRLSVRYETTPFSESRQAGKISLPVVFVDWKPESADPNTFRCRIRVGEDHWLKPVFPALKWNTVATDGFREYGFDLQVVPSWVKARIYSGQLPWLSLDQVIDTVVTLLLGLLLFFFFRHFIRR